MTSAILKRLGSSLLALFVLTIIVFTLLRLAPGSPVDAYIGLSTDNVALRDSLIDKFALDKSLPEQYAIWFVNLVQGDMGESAVSRLSVSESIGRTLRPTLEVAGVALAVAIAIALTLGTIAGMRRNSGVDRAATTLALIGMSVPDFVISLLLVLFVARNFSYFPTFGYASLGEGLDEWFRHIVLPAAALAAALTGVLTRLTRVAVAETMQREHVRTARGKGLRRRRIILSHIVRPSLIPVITLAGLALVSMLAGIVVIETVFSIPGMGRLVIDAIRVNDYPLIQGAILIIGAFAVVVSTLVDVLYNIVDPRIRAGRQLT